MANIIKIAIAISLIIILIGCTETPTGKIVEQETIEIGLITALTGKVATYGHYVKKGVDLAAEHINKNGGINGKKLVIITEDSVADPKTAINTFYKLTEQDNIKIIIGPLASSSVLAVAPLANEKQAVILTPIGSSPEITHAGDFVFRNRISGKFDAINMAEFCATKLKAKTAAILYINEDNGLGYRDYFTQTFENLGGKVLTKIPYERGADFRTDLTKIKALNPDIIYLGGHNSELAIKQAKELGIKSQLTGPLMFESQATLDIAGDAAEGFLYTYTFDSEGQDQHIKDFVKAYKEKHNSIPTAFSANAYDAVMIYAKTIEKCRNTGPICIKNELYKVQNHPGVSGTTSFDKNGDVEKPIIIKTVKNGEFVKYSD